MDKTRHGFSEARHFGPRPRWATIKHEFFGDDVDLTAKDIANFVRANEDLTKLANKVHGDLKKELINTFDQSVRAEKARPKTENPKELNTSMGFQY
jgi:hypothetical protein